MADVIIAFGEIGHDVGRLAAIGDDVVDPRRHRHMLAQVVDRDVHHLDAIERGPALVRCGGGVRADAVEAELARNVRLARTVADLIGIAGVPVQHRIDIVEQACADQIDLARPTFLGR